MKQQIKCPHCNKVFPIEESLKHEAQEYRKKLQKEEQLKSKKREQELENKLNQRLEKQQQEHQKQLEKIKIDEQKKFRVAGTNSDRDWSSTVVWDLMIFQ